MKIAVEPKELQEDKELQKILSKHFIRRYYEKIRCNTYPDHKKFDKHWVQRMLYNQMEVLFDEEVI